VTGAMYLLLNGSQILLSHAECNCVQDPYSIRCIPQVMDTCLDNLTHAVRMFTTKINTTYNLVIFYNSDVIFSNDFHANLVAFVSDIITLDIIEISIISERSLVLLIDADLLLLPLFLFNDSFDSGFIIIHVTAAILVLENKSNVHLASVDIPI
jgi:histidine ammonia-lyase